MLFQHLSVIISAMMALACPAVTANPIAMSREIAAARPSAEEIEAAAQGEKYFFEPGGGEVFGHYDVRFYRGAPVDDLERHRTQHNMIRAYLSTMRTLGYETWLAHGSLLGWWWNGRSLPWDGDFDVQVWAESLHSMAKHHNMTKHEYKHYEFADDKTKVEEHTSTYLLDVNPNHVDRTRGNWNNLIDARWIDTSNGLFIDITGLSETGWGVWTCKNQHAYATGELLPLQETLFEGTKALVPHMYERILSAEYMPGALVNTEFKEHRWNEEQQLWIQI